MIVLMEKGVTKIIYMMHVRDTQKYNGLKKKFLSFTTNLSKNRHVGLGLLYSRRSFKVSIFILHSFICGPKAILLVIF